MPRSRDFPANGIEFIKQWKSNNLDKIAVEIQIQKNKSSDVDILDIKDWSDVKTLVGKIDELIERSSLDDKEVLKTCKLHILDHLQQSVLNSKESVEHSHNH